MHFNRRYITHTRHQVIVKIILLHQAVFESDLVYGCSAQGHHDRAFYLCLNDIGIDIPATVHHGPNLVDLHFSVRFSGYFYDLPYGAVKTSVSYTHLTLPTIYSV